MSAYPTTALYNEDSQRWDLYEMGDPLCIGQNYNGFAILADCFSRNRHNVVGMFKPDASKIDVNSIRGDCCIHYMVHFSVEDFMEFDLDQPLKLNTEDGKVCCHETYLDYILRETNLYEWIMRVKAAGYSKIVLFVDQ